MTDTVRALEYPSGQNGWLPLPEGWSLEWDETAEHEPCVSVIGRNDYPCWRITAKRIEYGVLSASHAEADVIHDVSTWARLGRLQDHRPGDMLRDAADHRVFGRSCSCRGQFIRSTWSYPLGTQYPYTNTTPLMVASSTSSRLQRRQAHD